MKGTVEKQHNKTQQRIQILSKIIPL